ncbi:MAG: BatD family protein [Arenicellales bacterium]
MSSFYLLKKTECSGAVWLQLLTLITLLFMAHAGMAAVQASIDRSVVYEGESFTLAISSDAKQSDMPDLSLLEKDFQVLGTGNSQQVQVVNGVMTAKTSWTISLQARTSGQFHIPSLRVGNELTNPIQVTVTAPPEASTAMDGQHIFIETEIAASEKPFYLQQQILFTVRLVFDKPLLEGSLSEPEPENALVEQLGKNSRYTSQRNGKSFSVIERRYAIFPEKSGELVIPPLRFTGSLASDAGRRSSSRIDPSMRQFFGGDPFAGVFDRGRPVTLQGKAVTVDIIPRPASYSASHWLPAAGLELEDSWAEQPPEFKVGEPVNRIISIKAKGLLATLLPKLEIADVDGVSIYPEQPVTESSTDGTWVFGESNQSVSYMPTRADALIIPELQLSWWDTQAGVERTAVLPKWSVDVLPGKDMPVEPDVQTEDTAVAAQQSDSSAAEDEEGRDSTQEKDGYNKTLREYWWLLLILAVVVLALTRQWSKKSDAAHAIDGDNEKTAAHRQSLRELQKHLDEACSRNDANSAAEALLKMAALAKPESPPKTLPALAALLEQGSEELIHLDRSLYATNEMGWDGRQFYEKFRNGLAFRADEKPVRDALKPLYPD